MVDEVQWPETEQGVVPDLPGKPGKPVHVEDETGIELDEETEEARRAEFADETGDEPPSAGG